MGMLKLPDKNLTASMYQTAVKLLNAFNLERYEVANFATEGTEAIHNSSYWDGSQYIGIGPGAHSRFYVRDHNSREARIQCLEPKLWQQMVEGTGHGTKVSRSQSHLEILSELLVTSLRTKTGTRQERYVSLDAF